MVVALEEELEADMELLGKLFYFISMLNHFLIIINEIKS